MSERTIQVDDLRLVAEPSAVRCAELFVQFTLHEWRLMEMLQEATRVATSLVHAVLDHQQRDEESFLVVRLRLRGHCLVVEVEDENARPPLSIPDELADNRGGCDTLDNLGQMLWCEVDLPRHTDASSVSLPRRHATKRVAPQPDTDVEPVSMEENTMKRIIAALGDG